MPELTKQIRLRATDEEKSTLETAASDGGYANVSDYLRHFLFDQHVLIVGDGEHGDLFRLIPAFSSVEAERDAAVVNLEGLLALGEQLKAAVRAEGLAPTSPGPAAIPDSQVPPASPVAPAEPAPAPVAVVPPPQAPLAAAPEPEPLSGPQPAVDENFDAFMERRVGELTLTGLSSMRSSLEAEAEWRSAMDASPEGAPAVDAPPLAAAAQPSASFCSQCGTALGGPFCSSCGHPAA